MVRGVTSGPARQHGILISLLAELTTAGFFSECFKGMAPEPKLSDTDKRNLAFAVAVTGLLMDKADGWQFLSYMNETSLRIVDGFDSKMLEEKPLLLTSHQGHLGMTDATSKALEDVPERYTISGCWFSKEPEMQNHGLLMTRETFKNLFHRRITLEQLFKESEIVPVESNKYTTKYSKNCGYVQAKVDEGEEPSADATQGPFVGNDSYLFLQGAPAEALEEWVGCSAAEVFTNVMVCCVAARYEDPTKVPAFEAFYHPHGDKKHILVFQKNSSKDTYNFDSSVLPELSNGTKLFKEYVKAANSNDNGLPTLFQRIRPFLAVAKRAVTEYTLFYTNQCNHEFSPNPPVYDERCRVEVD